MVLRVENLSEAEQAALRWIRDSNSTLVSAISEKTTADIFGHPVPGLTIFKKLERKGLCFQTEEEPDEDGFTFTESIEFTEAGRELAAKL